MPLIEPFADGFRVWPRGWGRPGGFGLHSGTGGGNGEGAEDRGRHHLSGSSGHWMPPQDRALRQAAAMAIGDRATAARL